MKRLPVAWMVIAIAVINVSGVQSQSLTLPALEFAERIKGNPEAAIIDVRTPEEFAKGHIPDARNFDWNADRFVQQISSLNTSKPVFVYCLSGGRSADAVDNMRSLGFTQIFELKGGLLKWRNAGLPEARETITSLGMTRQEFDRLLISDKLVLVDFYADWCAPCKKMKPSLDKIAQDLAGEVTVVRINADDHPNLCHELKVDALPVLVLYEKGTLIWKNKGYLSFEEILTALSAY